MTENTHKGEGGGITDPAYPAKFMAAMEGMLAKWPEKTDWKAAHDDQVRRKRVAQAEVRRLRGALRDISETGCCGGGDQDNCESALIARRALEGGASE